MAKSSCCKCYFFRFYCRLCISYSLRSSIIWNEILGVRASFRVVTVGHYRVFRFMAEHLFIDYFSTHSGKNWLKIGKKLIFAQNVNVKEIWIYYRYCKVNRVTFWEILFLRCLSEKCQGFGNELWFFGFRALVLDFGWQVTIFLLVVWWEEEEPRIEVYFSIILDDGYSSKSNFVTELTLKWALQNTLV